MEPEKAERQLQRLQRIAREAAMQSRQVRIPEIKDIREVRLAAADSGAALTHRTGSRPSLKHSVLYIGPEGGWGDSELVDMPTINLGPSQYFDPRRRPSQPPPPSPFSREDLLDNHSP